MTRLLTVLWPLQVDPRADGLARFGRLLHWSAVVIAGVIGLLVFSPVFETFSDGEGYLLIAAPIALLGRGLRYVFAGE